MNPRRIYTYGGKPARRNLTVADGSYPDGRTSVPMRPNEHEKLLEALDARQVFRRPGASRRG